MVAAFMLPLLLLGAPGAGPEPLQPRHTTGGAQPLDRKGAAERLWLARLLVQIAEAALFLFLYLSLRSIDPAIGDHLTARVFSFVLCAPVALLSGRWADRHARLLGPLILCTLNAPLGLVGMALSYTLPSAIAGYHMFGLSTSIFLTLHSEQTLRTLPSSNRCGCDLGLFNLTSTMP